VVLEGTGRAFCAGGDIGYIYERAGAGHAEDGPAYWADEYRLVLRLAQYPKPVVAFMSGIVMGGGVGLSAHTPHRIVTETTRFAMPEVTIGVIPDVGASWLFSRASGEIGTYLALTGTAIGPADVLAFGFADAYVPTGSLEALATELGAEGAPDHERIRTLVARHAAPSPPPDVANERKRIDTIFSRATVAEILAALDADGTAFAQTTAQTIREKSPTSLTLTLRELREARGLGSLAACLALEYRLISRVILQHDFLEGVRAAVIDKDRHPQWQPSDLRDVQIDDFHDGHSSATRLE
jgi:enoyl-CoA hydratase